MTSIIDLGSEDIDSLIKIIENLGEKFRITTDETEIIKSDRIILTASDDSASALRQLHLFNLFTILRICRKPFLGICSGMHLFADHSEDMSASFLGIFPVDVEAFKSTGNMNSFKGMHGIKIQKDSSLFAGIQNGENFYFSNSHYIPINEFTTSAAENNIKFSASLEKNNYYGVQFSPEKSGDAGVKLIQNFIELQA